LVNTFEDWILHDVMCLRANLFSWQSIHCSLQFQAPPRAEVVKSLRNGIIVNLLGMGAAILGMQATVGSLVAKALTTSATPYYQAAAPVSSPVLPLDVFLVQVCL